MSSFPSNKFLLSTEMVVYHSRTLLNDVSKCNKRNVVSSLEIIVEHHFTLAPSHFLLKKNKRVCIFYFSNSFVTKSIVKPTSSNFSDKG